MRDLPGRGLMVACMLMASGPLWAEIYRCQEGEGVVYQDRPCPGEGEQIELRVDRPNPEEVERQQARRAGLRAVIKQAEEARLERSPPPKVEKPATPAKKPEATPGSQPQRSTANRAGEDNARGSDGCPLGLANCKKPGERVFRRPAEPRTLAEP